MIGDRPATRQVRCTIPKAWSTVLVELLGDHGTKGAEPYRLPPVAPG